MKKASVLAFVALIAVAIVTAAAFLKRTPPQFSAPKTAAPGFDAPKKLEYTYIIDGNLYSDRLISGDEDRAFDLLRLSELVGVSVSRGEKEITLSYLGSEAKLVPLGAGKYGVRVSGKKLDAGIEPYEKERGGAVYVPEWQIIALMKSSKLPLSVKIDEDAKTVTAANPLFDADASEPVRYFDIAKGGGREIVLSYYEGNIILDDRASGARYQKEAGGGFLDGRVVFPEGPAAANELTVYLWDGKETKAFPLKLADAP